MYDNYMNCKHIIFDLDDTLYKSETMHDGVRNRMLSFVANYMGVTFEEAKELRKKNIPQFATTLEWLLSTGLESADNFFEYVHPDSEADELDSDPNLRPLLESIKIPKSVLTNSPHEHADRVLKKLGVFDLFETVIDIRDMDLRGKPYADSYYKALEKVGCTIDEAIFLDDQLKYTDGFELLGGIAIQVGEVKGSHIKRNSKSYTEMQELFAQRKIPVPKQPGKTFHIGSVYELPALLQNICDL